MTIQIHRLKNAIRRNRQKQKLTEKDKINSVLTQRQPALAVTQMMVNWQLFVKTCSLAAPDNQGLAA